MNKKIKKNLSSTLFVVNINFFSLFFFAANQKTNGKIVAIKSKTPIITMSKPHGLADTPAAFPFLIAKLPHIVSVSPIKKVINPINHKPIFFVLIFFSFFFKNIYFIFFLLFVAKSKESFCDLDRTKK